MKIKKERFLSGMTRFNYWDYFVCDFVSDHIEIKLPSKHALSDDKINDLPLEFDRILSLRFQDYAKAEKAWKDLENKIFRTKELVDQVEKIKRDQKLFKRMIELIRNRRRRHNDMTVEGAALHLTDDPVNTPEISHEAIRKIYWRYNEKAQNEYIEYKQLDINFLHEINVIPNSNPSFDEFLDNRFFPCLDLVLEAMERWLHSS